MSLPEVERYPLENYVPYESASDIPVLLLVFKRPDLTRDILKRLREIGVKRLFVSSDGPSTAEEKKQVAEVRQIIKEEFSLSGAVTVRFLDKNTGAREAVTSAIDWFFTYVDEGIILEDDCLPSVDFFRLCADLLPRFREHPRVFQIAGDNSAKITLDKPWSYCFIRYPHIWGWATWKTAWNRYDRNLEMWSCFEKEGMLDSLFSSDIEREIWSPIYSRLQLEGTRDIWDFQWAATLAMNDGLSVQALPNLISNRGFGANATHTKTEGSRSNCSYGELGEIVHPLVVYRSKEAEFQVLQNTQLHFLKRPVTNKIFERILKIAKALMSRLLGLSRTEPSMKTINRAS